MVTRISTTGGRLGLGNTRTFVRLTTTDTLLLRNGEDAKAEASRRGLDLAENAIYLQRDPIEGIEVIVGPAGLPAPQARDWPSAHVVVRE